MKILRVLSTSLNNVSAFVVKAWNGLSDTRTAKQYGPYGFDSNPIKNISVIYSRTEVDGSEVITGCLNKGCVTATGESRMFSTDTSGNLKYNIWLKSNGTVLMGKTSNESSYTNNAVKYNESKSESDKLKATVNDLVTKWNAFANSYAPGSPSTTGTPPTLAGQTVSANNSDFSLIKHDDIKYE